MYVKLLEPSTFLFLHSFKQQLITHLWSVKNRWESVKLNCGTQTISRVSPAPFLSRHDGAFLSKVLNAKYQTPCRTQGPGCRMALWAFKVPLSPRILLNLFHSDTNSCSRAKKRRNCGAWMRLTPTVEEAQGKNGTKPPKIREKGWKGIRPWCSRKPN